MPPKLIKKSVRKRPSQRRSEETVEAILQAAVRVFAFKGLTATTTQIAEVAGVSVGSFYQYFPDKHSLLLELREKRFALLFAEFLKINEVMAKEPLERALDRALLCILDHVSSQADLHRLLIKELPLMPGTEWAERYNNIITSGLREMFLSHRNEIASANLELSIFTVSAAIRGMGRSVVRDKHNFDNRSLASELARMIVRHLISDHKTLK